jgi:uncharacterized protein GlcG (DUF336 family)
MKSTTFSATTGLAAALVPLSFALAAGAILPGDHGKPGGDGIPAVNPAPRPPGAAPAPRPQDVPVRAPSLALALKAAQAIDEACKQYKLGIAVVNAAGVPILVYIPDRSPAFHSYTAVRKAYSALTFQAPTIQMIGKAQQDAEFAAKIKADPNLVAFGGGIPLKVGDEIIGALGVSGAEPGGHDDECGQFGLKAIGAELR